MQTRQGMVLLNITFGGKSADLIVRLNTSPRHALDDLVAPAAACQQRRTGMVCASLHHLKAEQLVKDGCSKWQALRQLMRRTGSPHLSSSFVRTQMPSSEVYTAADTEGPAISCW